MSQQLTEVVSKMAEKVRHVDDRVTNMDIQLSRKLRLFPQQKTLKFDKYFQQIIRIQNQHIKLSSFPHANNRLT